MVKGAHPGNTCATKLKDPDLRQEAYRQYCEHIASGLPMKAWFFEHPTDPTKSLSYKTMERYMRENPNEFPPSLKEAAQSKSYAKWFKEGGKLMVGEYRYGSPHTWATIMRNMFQWDRETEPANTVEPEARRLWEAWKES
jgi:hypothetical protein